MTVATAMGIRTGRERTAEVTSRFTAGYELVSGDPSSEVSILSCPAYTGIYDIHIQLMLCTQYRYVCGSRTL